MTKLPKPLEQKRDELTEKIGIEYTKLVNSFGSVEKNLDFNAARWGAEKGFDAGALEVLQRAEKLVESLEIIAEQADMHDNPFASDIASETLADWQQWREGK